MSPEPVVEASGLDFSYGTKPVLNGISFSIDPGRSVAFVGPSGCGKTTLLHLVAGIRRPSSGVLRVNARRLSYVFQHDTLLPWRSVLGNVLLPFELAGEPVTPGIRTRAIELLGVLGIAGTGGLAPAELSGGMKKRVELARALVTEPDLLILDEPFSALDLITRERLNVLLRNVHARTGTTMVLVTHSVEEACFLSDRVHVLSGRPSSIIGVQELTAGRGPAPEQFILGPLEAAASAEIRRSAKVLWTSPPEAADGEPGAAAHAGRTDGRIATWPSRLAGFARRRWAGLLIPLELAAAILLVAFLKGAVSIPDFILPHPFAVFSRFAATLADGSILPELGTTVYESLLGFLVAFALTTVLGYAIAKSKTLSRLLMPWLVAANTIPSVALAPFLVLWFGFGMAPRVITAIIVIFFPMLVNTISAIRLAGEQTAELADFFQPSRARRFAYFELPASLPVIASGVKVSITLSVIGAVVGEFVSGRRGLGALVSISKANFDVELMFVGLAWLVLLGLAYYGAAGGLAWLVARRRR
jgi:NitT/TauT family transport system ATP-binding protein